jgi:hypothetical protein
LGIGLPSLRAASSHAFLARCTSGRCIRRLAKGEASLQVRNIGNVNAILLAAENGDVIVLHGSSSICMIVSFHQFHKLSKPDKALSARELSPD